jgi:WhiB family redox-sensing transcriptional regulator
MVTRRPLDLDAFDPRGDPAEIVAAADAAAAERLARVLAALHPPWTRDAACRGEPARMFFPERGDPPGPALELCGRCAVRADCLAEAIADPSLDHGIRGGMTTPARQAHRRAVTARNRTKET